MKFVSIPLHEILEEMPDEAVAGAMITACRIMSDRGNTFCHELYRVTTGLSELRILGKLDVAVDVMRRAANEIEAASDSVILRRDGNV